MASKQPFKLIDVTSKLKTWSLRFKKVVNHRILSKRRNVLFLGQNPNQQFTDKLKAKMKKTWDIYELHANPSIIQAQSSKQQNGETSEYARQYDAVILLPEQSNEGLFSFRQEQFASSFQTFKSQYLFHLFAYKMAHKYLTTSGVIILSGSQSDFLSAEKLDKPLPTFPSMKNILETQKSYLGVTIGDRDYTDLNSWSVTGLSEELVNSDEDSRNFIAQMYCQWADGKQLPMPGSFALFKMEEKNKKKPFVQYL